MGGKATSSSPPPLVAFFYPCWTMFAVKFHPIVLVYYPVFFTYTLYASFFFFFFFFIPFTVCAGRSLFPIRRSGTERASDAKTVGATFRKKVGFRFVPDKKINGNGLSRATWYRRHVWPCPHHVVSSYPCFCCLSNFFFSFFSLFHHWPARFLYTIKQLCGVCGAINFFFFFMPFCLEASIYLYSA